MRIEKDTLGEVRVPDDALYGAQTQRAVENYPISGLREHPLFIRAFILLKRAAALANRELGAMDETIARRHRRRVRPHPRATSNASGRTSSSTSSRPAPARRST